MANHNVKLFERPPVKYMTKKSKLVATNTNDQPRALDLRPR